MTNAIEESLFGVKDFGELNLTEFAKLFAATDYTISEYHASEGALHQLVHRLYVMAYTGNPELVKNLIDPTGGDKIKELFAAIEDTERKYGIKFEIMHNKSTNPFIIHILIKVLVDDVCVYSFDLWCHYKCNAGNSIRNLNDAHEKYLQTLYYAEFKENMTRITEGIVAEAMHPRRLIRHLELGGEIDDF
jgi:hypothetical protein